MCGSPLPCFLEEVRALGELRGCGAGGGDMEPVPLSWSGCSPETETKYDVPLQGIPNGSPGVNVKREKCQSIFWTCLLASHSSSTRGAVVRRVGVWLGLLRCGWEGR